MENAIGATPRPHARAKVVKNRQAEKDLPVEKAQARRGAKVEASQSAVGSSVYEDEPVLARMRACIVMPPGKQSPITSPPAQSYHHIDYQQ